MSDLPGASLKGGRFSQPATRDRTHEARDHDAYMTIDPRPIPALLRHLKPRGVVWEPAAGNCDMVHRLLQAGYKTCSTDLIARIAGVAYAQDFFQFSEPPNRDIQTIITNPPNKLNLSFAQHAIKMMKPVQGLVAFYQRHEWDTTQRAACLFDHPAYAIKVVCRFRPVWVKPKPGEKPPSPFHKWSWYVWDWQHQGPPIMRFA